MPHRLTISGRYDRKTRAAVLRGKLTGAGRVRAGTQVFVGRFTTRDFSDYRLLGSAKTDATGRYTVRARISGRTTFVVAADARVKPCATPGCAGQTTAPPPSVSITVSPSR